MAVTLTIRRESESRDRSVFHSDGQYTLIIPEDCHIFDFFIYFNNSFMHNYQNFKNIQQI